MSKRLRPSLRKLEKAEIAAQPGSGFRSTYDAREAAVSRIQARLAAALDRICVASQSDEFSGALVAQLQHARRFVQEGRARRFVQEGRDEREGFPFRVSGDTADELVRTLAELYHDAYVAELMDRASARAKDEVAES